ncbi:MAG: dTDP-glucose 4,6-dehydratase [Bdellovibrionales bacterium]|nr:dTDP-glucose 4,6-dehydratase [Bdellovibrionales bacterium]
MKAPKENGFRCVVTGGCGFIGSNFISLFLAEYPLAKVLNLDSMTYAAHPQTARHLDSLAPERYQHVRGDIADPQLGELLSRFKPDAVVNFAAETHVDKSILDPSAFVQTNVAGVQNLLTLARKQGNVRFLQVSTDEVYGSLNPDDPTFTESSPLTPSSPYAAAKASGDLFALAAHHTFGQDVVITRCTNNFGPYQYPEKLIPLVIANALEDKPIPIYGDGQQVRDWLHVVDHCRAIALVLATGKSGEVYNVSASEEHANLNIVRGILERVGKPESLIRYVKDRPGHDRRYGLSAAKIRHTLGWSPKLSFEEGLDQTVEWYLQNSGWWRSLRDEAYAAYYQANYAPKVQEQEKPL